MGPLSLDPGTLHALLQERMADSRVKLPADGGVLYAAVLQTALHLVLHEAVTTAEAEAESGGAGQGTETAMSTTRSAIATLLAATLSGTMRGTMRGGMGGGGGASSGGNGNPGGNAPRPSLLVWHVQVGVRSNDELFRIFQGGAGEMDTLLDQYFMDATTRTILTKKGLLTDSIRRAAPVVEGRFAATVTRLEGLEADKHREQVKAEWKRRAVDVVSEAELAQILSKVNPAYRLSHEAAVLLTALAREKASALANTMLQHAETIAPPLSGRVSPGGLSPIAAREETKTTGPQDRPPTSEPALKAKEEEECVLMDAEWVWGCMREDFPASTMTACLGLLRKTHPDLATHVSHVAQSAAASAVSPSLKVMVRIRKDGQPPRDKRLTVPADLSANKFYELVFAPRSRMEIADSHVVFVHEGAKLPPPASDNSPNGPADRTLAECGLSDGSTVFVFDQVWWDHKLRDDARRGLMTTQRSKQAEVNAIRSAAKPKIAQPATNPAPAKQTPTEAEKKPEDPTPSAPASAAASAPKPTTSGGTRPPVLSPSKAVRSPKNGTGKGNTPQPSPTQPSQMAVLSALKRLKEKVMASRSNSSEVGAGKSPGKRRPQPQEAEAEEGGRSRAVPRQRPTPPTHETRAAAPASSSSSGGGGRRPMDSLMLKRNAHPDPALSDKQAPRRSTTTTAAFKAGMERRASARSSLATRSSASSATSDSSVGIRRRLAPPPSTATSPQRQATSARASMLMPRPNASAGENGPTPSRPTNARSSMAMGSRGSMLANATLAANANGGPPSLRLLPSAPLRPEDDVALKWLLLKLTMADISAKIRQGARPPATAPTRGGAPGVPDGMAGSVFLTFGEDARALDGTVKSLSSWLQSQHLLPSHSSAPTQTALALARVTSHTSTASSVRKPVSASLIAKARGGGNRGSSGNLGLSDPPSVHVPKPPPSAPTAAPSTRPLTTARRTLQPSTAPPSAPHAKESGAKSPNPVAPRPHDRREAAADRNTKDEGKQLTPKATPKAALKAMKDEEEGEEGEDSSPPVRRVPVRPARPLSLDERPPFNLRRTEIEEKPVPVPRKPSAATLAVRARRATLEEGQNGGAAQAEKVEEVETKEEEAPNRSPVAAPKTPPAPAPIPAPMPTLAPAKATIPAPVPEPETEATSAAPAPALTPPSATATAAVSAVATATVAAIVAASTGPLAPTPANAPANALQARLASKSKLYEPTAASAARGALKEAEKVKPAVKPPVPTREAAKRPSFKEVTAKEAAVKEVAVKEVAVKEAAKEVEKEAAPVKAAPVKAAPAVREAAKEEKHVSPKSPMGGAGYDDDFVQEEEGEEKEQAAPRPPEPEPPLRPPVRESPPPVVAQEQEPEGQKEPPKVVKKLHFQPSEGLLPPVMEGGEDQTTELPSSVRGEEQEAVLNATGGEQDLATTTDTRAKTALYDLTDE